MWLGHFCIIEQYALSIENDGYAVATMAIPSVETVRSAWTIVLDTLHKQIPVDAVGAARLPPWVNI